MNSKILFLFIAFILLVSSAHAIVVSGVPNTITFYQQPKEFEFSVTNTSASNQTLSVNFYAPLRSEATIMPNTIAAASTETVKLKLIPDKSLTGTTYSSTLIVKLGDEESEHKIELNFRELLECPIEISTAKIESDVNGNHKLILKIRLQNFSVEDIGVKFLGIQGIPADWSYTQDKAIEFVPALGIKETNLDFKFGSPFNGKANIVFKCGNFGNVEKSISLKHTVKSSSAITGFFALGKISSLELAIDILLIFIAAILLIAFISRAVKKFTKEEIRRRRGV